MDASRLTRRSLIKLAAATAGASLLAACGGTAAPSPTPPQSAAASSVAATKPAAAPTAAGAAPTAATTGSAPAAASAPAQRGGRTDLRVTLPAEPAVLNPVLVSGDRNFSKVSWQLYDALTVYDYQTGKLQPQLATAWQQKSPTVWEFKLREGVQFHKGYGELTADDVEFMVNKVVGENKPLKFLYFFVQGAKATGKYTVEYTLSQPFPPFPVTTVRDRAGMIVSKKAYMEMGEEKFNRNPIGTGPFQFDSWDSGKQIVLKKFDKYWQAPLPNLDSITFRIVGDTVTRESLLKTGEVDFIDAPDYKNIATWRKDANYALTSIPAWGTDWIPVSVTVPPFDKPEVRQAIAYAVDRDAIAKGVYFGEAQADQGPLPSGFIGYPSPQVYPLKADVAKAKSLLSAAGFGGGLKVTALTTAQFKTLAEVISGQVSEAGIQMTVEVVDPGTQSARTTSRKFEVNVGNLAFLTPDSDSTMYWFLHSETIGNYGYNNPTVNTMLEQARSIDDASQRAALYQNVLKQGLADAPFIYLLHPNIVRIRNKGLVGVPDSPQDSALIFREARWS